jgi:hypothetical protein
MNTIRRPSGPIRNVAAKLLDAVIATMILATAVAGFKGVRYLLSTDVRLWSRPIPVVNMVIQFSAYMHSKRFTFGDAMVGIEVALDDQRLTWRAAAFYRSVVAGLMFNPYSPVNLGSVTLWAVAACSLVARKSVPGKELLWDSLAGTRALIAGSGDLPGAAD